MYDRLFTADEVQALLQAANTPALEAEIQALRVLIRRVLALDPAQAQPRGRRRGGAGRRWYRTVLFQQIDAVGRAADVLQRLLKTQQTLAKDGPSELFQLLDEAAKYMDDPSLAPDPADDPVIEEYDPVTRTFRPYDPTNHPPAPTDLGTPPRHPATDPAAPADLGTPPPHPATNPPPPTDTTTPPPHPAAAAPSPHRHATDDDPLRQPSPPP